MIWYRNSYPAARSKLFAAFFNSVQESEITLLLLMAVAISTLKVSMVFLYCVGKSAGKWSPIVNPRRSPGLRRKQKYGWTYTLCANACEVSSRYHLRISGGVSLKSFGKSDLNTFSVALSMRLLRSKQNPLRVISRLLSEPKE